MIRTERLTLIPTTVAALEAELRGRAAFAAATGFEVPESWPPELYDEGAVLWTIDRLRSVGAKAADFWGYYFTWNAPDSKPVVIGVGGFKGPPSGGRVELGYSVLEPYQRRGFAREAVEGMLAFAFSHPEVDEVIAETLPELTPSIGVLNKTGFSLVGPGSEEGVIRFAISRAVWGARVARAL